MTKSELVEELAAQSPELEKRDVESAVDALFEVMTHALATHQRIEVRGFGAFVAKARRARDARNPRTGAHVKVAAKHVPFFTAGKELRERVNAL